MKKKSLIAACGVLAFVAILLIAVFIIESQSSRLLTGLVSDTNSFKDDATLSFTNIEAVNLNVKDIPISIIDGNVDEVTITSTVQNNGIGFATQPKVWAYNNTLYYNQGIIFGIEPKSTGSVIVEIPADLRLDYNIKNGSGDVLFEVATANNAKLDMAIGELNIYTVCENLTADTVSGDINIYEAMKTIAIDTVSSDVSLSADATTDKINIKSVSGDCNIYSDELAGYNLDYRYAGGNIDEYVELSSSYNNIIHITADTVDGDVEVFDRSMLDDLSNFWEDK